MKRSRESSSSQTDVVETGRQLASITRATYVGPMRGVSNSETVRVSQNRRFDGVKVFSATMPAARLALGDVVTEWIAANPEHAVTEIVVTQSSDFEFHCVSMTIFYAHRSLLAELKPVAS